MLSNGLPSIYKFLSFVFFPFLFCLYVCTSNLISALLYFVTFSNVLYYLIFSLVPYSFVLLTYGFGGPYLLCLDFYFDFFNFLDELFSPFYEIIYSNIYMNFFSFSILLLAFNLDFHWTVLSLLIFV